MDEKRWWIVTVLTILMTCQWAVVPAQAQEEPEYRLEIGAGAGGATYLGDFNGKLTSKMQPWGCLMAKYRLNPRMALGLTIGFTKIKGAWDKGNTWYPLEDYSFNHSLTDAGIRYEYNFWAFGTGREYRGAKRLTPFISLGLGATFYGGNESGVTANIPLGAGIKYKAGTRLNLAAEIRMHLAMSDKLDGIGDPYGIKSNGLLKNTDSYSVVQIALTYDLWAKCKTCNNDRY